MALLKEKIRDHSAEEMLFIRRAGVALALVIVCFGVLIFNLYRVQIEQHGFYQTRSNQNDIKMLPIAPSRGLIFDRNGIPLVRNITLYQIEVTPSKIDNMAVLLQTLTPIVDLTPDDISTFRDEMHRNSRYKPVTLKTGLSDTEVARFAVNQYRFAGVTIDTYQQREYPYGAQLAHVVGYVSKINDGDLKRLDKAGLSENYAADRNIGKQGIEGYYESELHGTTGYQEVEVDNHGRVIRLLKEQPPQAGKNIYLTLDLRLQQYIESVLKGQRAAVVVEDPRDGGILAMVSSPSYDPNPFVKGISYQAYKSLLGNPDLPLINRVTQGLYPPASTVKPYMATSALFAGVITPNTTFFGAPTWTLPGTQRRYRDWLKTGHGLLNVTKAIEESADTFFYQVAFEMGIDRIHSWLSRFGYGQLTGIDLNEEYRGVLPSRAWKQKVHKKPWYQGDTVSVGIGQGYWVATPIQMVKALTTLINNGQVKTPHLLYSTKQGNVVSRYRPPAQAAQVGDAKSPYWGIVRNGMYGMANLPNGTGYKLFHTAPYQIAAKSGTSQVFSLKENQTYNAKMIPVRLRDHIFYTLFAPYKNPRVAMALILENGGGDGVVAGPTARAILDHIFDPAHAPQPGDHPEVKPQLNDSADVQQ
ncbi:penicillin-binding protein 2 [Serratia entomophila]|uniref:penicillin-binding protein 2 n=1 Tax=Serratia entomophila TaxID=42906 RepID=UPI0021779ED3|nr:penicillin-binding protein 2 [Serratia entomophila]CAI0912824.1 Peptidoglycan synthase FtsI precursor [Serratia entomophila]CAI1550154.1 Peptidoglycan synthase FtsI precursor [Serratia entomophila]CAI1584879.1 Peptidoglycan synthase FtsI precursor [Serratia entomophila]CAI1599633.1 Peptidoglycan synthase FtsI precursor [Serratia entomophila]CAI1606062.1 Peptidoglycan synthase FtsI precursor [Serratia entomophila]